MIDSVDIPSVTSRIIHGIESTNTHGIESTVAQDTPPKIAPQIIPVKSHDLELQSAQDSDRIASVAYNIINIIGSVFGVNAAIISKSGVGIDRTPILSQEVIRIGIATKIVMSLNLPVHVFGPRWDNWSITNRVM